MEQLGCCPLGMLRGTVRSDCSVLGFVDKNEQGETSLIARQAGTLKLSLRDAAIVPGDHRSFGFFKTIRSSFGMSCLKAKLNLVDGYKTIHKGGTEDVHGYLCRLNGHIQKLKAHSLWDLEKLQTLLFLSGLPESTFTSPVSKL